MKVMQFQAPGLTLWLGQDDRDIVLCDIHCPAEAEVASTPLLCRFADELRDYFAGRRRSFSVPFRVGGTDFQRRVLTEVSRIPYGSTVSYSRVAQSLGSPGAIRAVASAIASNKLLILIPCHRVVGKDGALRGYRGGLAAKRSLLALESAASIF